MFIIVVMTICIVNLPDIVSKSMQDYVVESIARFSFFLKKRVEIVVMRKISNKRPC